MKTLIVLKFAIIVLLFNEQVMMATTHEVIRVSNNHYPRVEHYTFSTTMVSLLDKLKLTFQTNVLHYYYLIPLH
jgi:hypothetical protein